MRVYNIKACDIVGKPVMVDGCVVGAIQSINCDSISLVLNSDVATQVLRCNPSISLEVTKTHEEIQ